MVNPSARQSFGFRDGSCPLSVTMYRAIALHHLFSHLSRRTPHSEILRTRHLLEICNNVSPLLGVLDAQIHIIVRNEFIGICQPFIQ